MNKHVAMVAAPTRAEIRAVVEFHRAQAARGKRRTNPYKVDRRDAWQYLVLHKEWSKRIQKFLWGLRDQGVPAVYVDICGRARGEGLGADINYSFSLQNKDHFIKYEDEVFIEGDLFNARDFGSFIRMLKENGHAPAFVTFEPVAGLQEHTPYKPEHIEWALTQGKEHSLSWVPKYIWAVTWQRLENNLRRLIEVLRPGGYIFLLRPFQLTDADEFFRRIPATEGRVARGVQRIVSEMRCTVEIVPSIVGPTCLIKKPKRWRVP